MHYNGFVAMSDEALGLAEKIVKGECGAERWEEVNEAPWIAEPPISASRGLDAIDAAYLSDRGPASYSGRLLAASALFTATTSVSLHFHGAVPAGCRHLYLRFREHAWATRGGAVGGMEAEVWAPDGTLVLVERQTRAAVGRVPVQAARM
ncbi:hypothetical protein DFJ74DRAFT_683894 [Hyaloraphidium curvatum]|nr:hypothetical protein DFJ74DRAFT_683894 [Hyaloraphidium curvatum]